MTLFVVLLTFVIGERIVELLIAKRNEKILKRQGAFEAGEDHYKWIVLLHLLFIVTLTCEVVLLHKRPTPWSWAPLSVFLLAQLARYWAIRSLGVFWNTKIIILPGARIVAKGPYRYLRHPNYLIVSVEILTLPLIFHAYFTAIVFTLLNTIMLIGVRIPDEEKALGQATNYRDVMGRRRRFIPKRPE